MDEAREFNREEFARLIDMIERLRKATGISRRVYARLCGVSEITYKNWVDKKRIPRGKRLEALYASSRAVNAARLAGKLPLAEKLPPYLKARKILDIVAEHHR